VCKRGAVAFEAPDDAQHLDGIAVCEQRIRKIRPAREPVVVVAHDHEAVARVEVLLPAEDAGADGGVEEVRPLV
jgi:hypothetical protein